MRAEWLAAGLSGCTWPIRHRVASDPRITSAQGHIQNHHNHEAEHEALHGESLVAVRLHLGHERVAYDKDHRTRGKRHRVRQHRPAVVHKRGPEHAANRLNEAGELAVPVHAQGTPAHRHSAGEARCGPM